MKRHKGSITCLKVSADGSVLVSGSTDGTVGVWNLRLGTSLSSLALANPVRQVSLFTSAAPYGIDPIDSSFFPQIAMAPDASKIWIRLHQQALPAILDLRHTPAVLIKPEVVTTKPASPGTNNNLVTFLLCRNVY